MFEEQSAELTVIETSSCRKFTELGPGEMERLVNVARDRDLMELNNLGGVEGVIQCLGTHAETGIPGDDEDVKTRIKHFGTNFNEYPKTGLMRDSYLCTKEAIKDPLIIILLVFALVSLFFGIKHHGIISVWPIKGTELVEIVALLVASAMANFWPITHSYHDLSAPKYLGYNPSVDVVRGGAKEKISIFKVVVGDIVFLKPGDQVPGEGLLIYGHSLHLENVITSNGRTYRAEIGRNYPFIFSGYMVTDGYSRMVVTAVANSRKKQQPKEVIWMKGMDAEELKHLTSTVALFGRIFAISTFMCFLLRFSAQANVDVGIVDLMTALARILTTSTIIALTSDLQGLSLAMKSILAYSMRSLLKDQVLIKKPALSHQVASVDTICFNKTGTLTSDESEVKKFWLGLTSIEDVPNNFIALNVLELLQQATGLLNTVQPRLSSTFPSSLISTEDAVFRWATQRGLKDSDSCFVLEIEPFNPEKRRSGVLISRGRDQTIHAHKRGAADVILHMCSHYYETTGTMKLIDNATRFLLEQLVKGMEEDGLRCIAFAHRKTSIEEYFNSSKPNLTLLGLAGLDNPLRTEVTQTVEGLQRAGINLKLLTGDSTSAAMFMALKAGLLDPEIIPGQVIEGIEFRNFSPEERMYKVRELRVLAKASPTDKLLLVESLKKNGQVVAYVGGGLSDARALKEANVGVCFGTEGGPEILKACSDVVIKHKNIRLIIETLKWGRGFYSIIQTYIRFLVTATFVDLVVDFVMANFSGSFLTIFYTVEVVSAAEVHVPVFQLLWVKLILATIAAFSVLINKDSVDLMSNSSRDPNEPLMTDGMQRDIMAQALYQTVVLLTIHFKGNSILNLSPSEKNTVIFNTYVLFQIFTLINAKLLERKNIFREIRKKKWFWGGIGIITLLQVIMVEVWKTIGGTSRLNSRQWGLCVFIAAASTPISWLLRYSYPMSIPYLTAFRDSNIKSKRE